MRSSLIIVARRGSSPGRTGRRDDANAAAGGTSGVVALYLPLPVVGTDEPGGGHQTLTSSVRVTPSSRANCTSVSIVTCFFSAP